MARTYQIMDEPSPGGLSRVAVQPVWPLFAVMFGGAWLSWPWFVLNAFAIGSPTRQREIVLAACGFGGNLALSVGIVVLLYNEIVPATAAPYLGLVLIVWKLAVTYWLYVLQARTFGLYQYYGGPVHNGLIVVVAGYFVGRAVPLLSAVLG